MKNLQLLKNELEGTELTVLQLDNKVIDLLEVEDVQSILNGDNVYYAFDNLSHTYSKNDIDYNVNFELVENTELKEDNIIKVTSIEII